MPSTRMRKTADGRTFFEISVSRGRGTARLTTRWYPPDGWSRKSIERELAKVAAAFEQKCKSGEILTRKETAQKELEAQKEEARIKTLTNMLNKYSCLRLRSAARKTPVQATKET